MTSGTLFLRVTVGVEITHTGWLAQWLVLWQYLSNSGYWVISLLRVCVRCVPFCRVLSKAGKDILLASLASGLLLSREPSPWT